MPEWLPQLDISPPVRQNRISILLRLLLLVPQYLALIALGTMALFVAVIGWFAALVLGRLPGWAFSIRASTQHCVNGSHGFHGCFSL